MASAALPFNEWTEALGSERLTGALLDRLTHHVHILEMNGESYRVLPKNWIFLKTSKNLRPLHDRRSGMLVSGENMSKTLDPFRFLLITVAGWMNQEQQHAIAYLREENRILRAHLGPRRLRVPSRADSSNQSC